MDIEFFEEVKKAGGQAYLVGGYVRDKILGLPNKDMDIEVFGLDENQLEKILDNFGRWKKAGIFEVYLLNNSVEISLSRDSRGEIKKEIDLEESAGRRDLTINALYYNPINHEIIDPLGGTEDIGRKSLRFCSEKSFMKDPLRILRAAYFSAKYGFEVSEELENLITDNRELVLDVPKERIFEELEKMLLKLEKPSEAFLCLKKWGVLELLTGSGEKLGFLDRLSLTERTPLIMWTKLYLINGSNSRFYFMHNNKKLNKEIENMLEAYRELSELRRNFSEYRLKKIAVKVSMKELLKLYRSSLEETGLEDKKFIRGIYRKYLNFREGLPPLIMGRDLLEMGFENRERFGVILDEIYEEQLKGSFDNKEDALNYVKIRYKEFTNLS